jgi:hypothetical protein
MIRRGFWLAAGAVLGVSGYRKASRLARTLTGQADARTLVAPGSRAQLTRRAQQTGRARQPTRAQQTTRDHVAAVPAGRLALPGRAPRRRSGAATAVARAAAAAGFVRDVREGMAEYWDLHRGEFDRTLGSRSDLASPAESQQARREA